MWEATAVSNGMNILAGISISVAILVVTFALFAPNILLQSLGFKEKPFESKATSTPNFSVKAPRESSKNASSTFIAPGFRGPTGPPRVKGPTSPPPNY